MKTTIITTWLCILLGAIIYIFWENEVKYTLPTPVPSDYSTVETGSRIEVKSLSKYSDKPLFIHFYNPDCPCSRFNVPHVRSLISKYSNNLNFAIVVLDTDKSYSASEIKDKFNADVPVLFDKSIAEQCGVYSTPQAVILDSKSCLYYRGNYNKSRYCTNKSSNYAEMAIDSLLTNSSNPDFSQYAVKAYGCSLPSCTRQ